MPDFSVHVDPDDLARQDLAAAVSLPPAGGGSSQPPSAVTAHHGAQDARLAARQRSERAYAGRKSGSARSYAFRRS